MPLVYFFACFVVLCLPAKLWAKPPNIVLILADDLGFSDLGCYGGEIDTPNLDALARQGQRFTQFTNTSRCCPSRAALLTGKYAHTVGMGWMTASDEHREGYRGQLSAEHPTIAEIFRQAGYATALSGKWHLTLAQAMSQPPNGSWPTERGFEKFFGCLAGGGSYRAHGSFLLGTEAIAEAELPEDFYYTTAITDHALQFIDEHDTQQPLFLYLAHYAPHRPLDAPKERVEACKSRYQQGYDTLRQQRLERLRQLGMVAEDATLAPLGPKIRGLLPIGGPLPTWDQLSAANQALWVEEMATYAAMVEIMDEGIGEVIQALEDKGMREDTLFVFMSDNGATFEGGLISTLAANLSNTPYQGYKQLTDLGGVASPLILSGAGIEGAGQLRTERSHIIDILPSCLNAAGLEYPNVFNEETVDAPAGLSLLNPSNVEDLQNRALYWEHQSSRAIASGPWRLVSLHEDHPWRLYDTRTDPLNQKDLAPQHPKIAKRLATQWLHWAETHTVLPLESLPWGKRINKYKALRSKH